ncbi:PPR repeat [Fragilaria crotonensis]|nr:PPR repeat [Fragilaria crotonensis]
MAATGGLEMGVSAQEPSALSRRQYASKSFAISVLIVVLLSGGDTPGVFGFGLHSLPATATYARLHLFPLDEQPREQYPRRRRQSKTLKSNPDNAPSTGRKGTHQYEYTNQLTTGAATASKSDGYLEIEALWRSARSPEEINLWLVRRNMQLTQDNNNNKDISTTNNNNLNPLRLHPNEQTQIIKELAKRSAFDEILFFLRHFSDHSVYVYSSVISSLAQSKEKRHSQQAFQLLQQMNQRGVRPNKFTFTALFHHIHGAKDARLFLQSLRQQNYKEVDTVEVYNAAIHACTRRQRQHHDANSGTMDDPDAWQTALHLYRTMRTLGLVPNRSTYSSLMLACAHAGQVKIAMALLDDMPMLPNDVVWGAALTVCARAGDYQQSLLILQKMQSLDAVATTRHVSAHLAALAKSGQDVVCLKVLEALQQKQPIELDHVDSDTGARRQLVLQPVPLDLVIVNTVIYACAQAGNYNDARRLLTDLKNGDYVAGHVAPAKTTVSNSRRETLASPVVVLQPDEITYNTVISACTDATQVKALVKEMRMSRRHRQGQVPPTAKTYTVAIAACKYDFETAMYLLQDSIHDGIIPNVFMYSAAIWIAEKCGKADEALRLLEEMKAASCEPNDVSYGGVIAAIACHGRALEAIQLFAEMKDKSLATNAKIFGRLAESIHRTSLQDKSTDTLSLLESVLGHMSPSDFSVKVAGPILEALILEYGMSDRFDDALSVFERISGPTNGPCLRAILSACALAPDRWEVALDLLHSCDIVEGARGPARLDMRAIGFAMLACSKSGQWEEALNLLELYGVQQEEADGAGHVPRSAINSLITACGRGGRPDMALKLLNDMSPKYGVTPNEISYRSAAIACNQAQHETLRRQERGQAPKFGGSTSSPAMALQWWECSLSLLRRMKEDGLQPDAQTYSSVISACEAAGQWQRALGVLRDGPQELNLYCFNAAISACEKGGAWVEALELYYQMVEKGGAVKPNFVTLSSLLIALDAASQKELAQDLYEQGLESSIVRRPWTRTRAASGDWIRALDFHNYSSAMARTAIRSVMESLISDGKPAHDVKKDLIVVVGKGKGSKFDPVLGQAVQEVLRDNYGVPCRVDPDNAGRLIVEASDLEAFATANNAWR